MKKLIALLTIISLFFCTDWVGAAATELASMSFYSDANLVAYYKLEDETDSEDDGTDYDLTNNNSTTFASAKFNNGADFSSNKYLSRTDTGGVADTDDWTISFWIKLDTEISEGYYNFWFMFTGTNNNLMRYDYNSGTRRLQVYSGAWEGGLNYNITMGTANWYHMAMTRVDGTGACKVYVNGSQVGSTFNATGSDASTPYMKIGGNSTAGDSVEGLIDDFAIFDRALSADEIASIYNGETPAATTAPNNGTFIMFE